MKKAFFPGSFDPFTVGHASVTRRALSIFDSVVIGIGSNSRKNYSRTAEQRREAIEKIYKDEPRVSVVAYEGLTVDAARKCGADVIVKGVRSIADFEYEREQADINRMLTGIDTVLLVAESNLAAVSSTMVRELESNGMDISKFIP